MDMATSARSPRQATSGTDAPLTRARRCRDRWKLTPRQVEVLALLATGSSNKEIAACLGCSTRTVELHLTNLFRKAACGRRTVLIARFWADR